MITLHPMAHLCVTCDEHAVLFTTKPYFYWHDYVYLSTVSR